MASRVVGGPWSHRSEVGKHVPVFKADGLQGQIPASGQAHPEVSDVAFQTAACCLGRGRGLEVSPGRLSPLTSVLQLSSSSSSSHPCPGPSSSAGEEMPVSRHLLFTLILSNIILSEGLGLKSPLEWATFRRRSLPASVSQLWSANGWIGFLVDALLSAP